MRNIIEEMYDGDLFPTVKITSETKKYQTLLNNLVESENNLLENYPEIKESFQKYQDSQIAVTSYNGKQEFLYGFRIGALLALEITKD